jgi:hypothetical protein
MPKDVVRRSLKEVEKDVQSKPIGEVAKDVQPMTLDKYLRKRG